MDYFQYQTREYELRQAEKSFKPYYKWITFNIKLSNIFNLYFWF